MRYLDVLRREMDELEIRLLPVDPEARFVVP